MTVDDISPWAVVIAVWVVAGVIVIVALVKTWPAIRRAVHTLEALSHLPEWMGQTTETMSEIRHEVFPNNGGSLRDRVDRALTWQEKHESKSDAVVARVDKLEKEKNE